MQVGIDVGATKIESVVLEKDGQEKHRSRISCPKNYTQIITSIKDIHKKFGNDKLKKFPMCNIFTYKILYRFLILIFASGIR